MTIQNLRLYSPFAHRLTDRKDIIKLYSIRIGETDWGIDQRFAEPIFNTDRNWAYTHEYKFCPALSNLLPKTGWNRREILIDITNCKFQAGSWKTISPDDSLLMHTNWKKINLFWKHIDTYTSPCIEKEFQNVISVNNLGFEFKYWNENIKITWRDLKKIHFSKTAVNTIEVPVLEGDVLTVDSQSYRFHLPRDLNHSFYTELVGNGYSDVEVLKQLLDSPEPMELTVYSNLGNMTISIDQKFDFSAAEKGIETNGIFIKWEDISESMDKLSNVKMGNLFFDSLEIVPNTQLNSRFPAQHFSFQFSSVNGIKDPTQFKKLIDLWIQNLADSHTVEFRPDWSTFLELKNHLFNLALTYTQSEGYGSLILTQDFYRKRLLTLEKYQAQFKPLHSYRFNNTETCVKSLSDFTPDSIYPCPDALHRPEVHLWKDDKGRMGLSDRGILYLWAQDDLVDLVDRVSDEYSDRGGPYYESILLFQDDSRITLNNRESIELAKEFLNISKASLP